MSTLALGQAPPAFTLTGVDEAEHSLTDYDDSVRSSWSSSATTARTCIAWEGRVMEIQRDYADRGVQVVAINSNDAATHPGTRSRIWSRAQTRQGFNFDYLHDPEQTVARALGAERTPEVFVFDRERRLVYHGAIDDNREETAVERAYLRDALDAVLAGETPETADTPAVGCTVKWLA